jgi:UDP-N-acetylmuramoyl-L-alanyl-D-glutamate--2,6-diaminopimelate ligase
MRLSEVIAGTGAQGDVGDDPAVALVTCDSRAVRPGAVFFALRGVRADGHDFAARAAAAGAVAVVADHPVECGPARLLLAASPRRALALAAANVHGRPAERLRLAGVTGTNGKTTVGYLVDACARAAGLASALVGTVVWRHPGGARPATHTTPDPEALQAFLRDAVAAGAVVATMEVSSHALEQERVAGLEFRAAGFTNLTRDHLDYHLTMDAYFDAKRRLFADHLAPGGVAVVNADNGPGQYLARHLGAAGRTTWSYGLAGGATIRAEEPRVGLDGIAARVRTPAGAIALRSPLVGLHNLENLLCAAGLALALGIPPSAVEAGLAACPGAPGRLERIERDGIRVLVDYAHTGDALARALDALRALGPRRLLCVFGCGGDRDRGKRPIMGEAAGRRADLVVATSDNPRGEDPLAILAEIVPGLEAAGLARRTEAEAAAGASGYAVVADRREAIRLAVRAARPGDAVLVAGKGHEDYQLVGGEKRPFDDREEARRALGIP